MAAAGAGRGPSDAWAISSECDHSSVSASGEQCMLMRPYSGVMHELQMMLHPCWHVDMLSQCMLGKDKRRFKKSGWISRGNRMDCPETKYVKGFEVREHALLFDFTVLESVPL